MAQPIVAAADGSNAANTAVQWAAGDARRRRLPLKVVHVCEGRLVGFDTRKSCEETVAAAADRARAAGGEVEVSTEMLSGNVVEALIGQSLSADSLVLGNRGRGGFTGLLLGSVSMAVAGHAAGPVVIVRESVVTEHGRIVVGDDGSDYAAQAVAYAVEQARARRASLAVVYAWNMPMVSAYASGYSDLLENASRQDSRKAQERVVRWRRDHSDIEIDDQQVCEHPVLALVNASAAADLVVVGSRGLGGFTSAMLGSVGHGVLHRAACPVAIVRPRGETS
ncbi:universal stress protein [Nonomuraea sp. B5E05]|uniref:universal stress protein n=1 Tax=Nonomuraea sp. B5E05 TaxID=3153569 RepID=UPI0032612C0D